MRSTTPTVSVLLATHNGAAYLKQALDSMAAQTFSDWEWVLVDDGSTDDTPVLLSAYAKQVGDRVRVLRNEANIGLTASLNRGLAEARGRYIARMDDDDVSHPERLARQIAVLDADDRLVLVGTSGTRLNSETGENRPYMPAYDPLRLRMCLCWFNPFMHASVMFRSRLPDGSLVRYDEHYVTAQDYALWASLSLHGRVAVLPQTLMTHRERSGGVTSTRRQEQMETTMKISEWYTEKLTGGTTLEGASPMQLRSWMDDPLFPSPERIVAMHRFSRGCRRLVHEPGSARQFPALGHASSGQDGVAIIGGRSAWPPVDVLRLVAALRMAKRCPVILPAKKQQDLISIL